MQLTYLERGPRPPSSLCKEKKKQHLLMGTLSKLPIKKIQKIQKQHHEESTFFAQCGFWNDMEGSYMKSRMTRMFLEWTLLKNESG